MSAWYESTHTTPTNEPFITIIAPTPIRDGMINGGITIPDNTEKSNHTILDSGERREFDTGAVRDIAEGKGRCDLMPLEIVGELMGDDILCNIGYYIYDGKESRLYYVIRKFAEQHYGTEVGDKPHRAELAEAMLEVAKHYEDGLNKYGIRNWEKGIMMSSYIDSATRHYLKVLRGDTDEPHDRAFVWNILGALWTIKHKPELNDLPFGKEKANGVD